MGIGPRNHKMEYPLTDLYSEPIAIIFQPSIALKHPLFIPCT